jgi:hypothetical protein
MLEVVELDELSAAIPLALFVAGEPNFKAFAWMEAAPALRPRFSARPLLLIAPNLAEGMLLAVTSF